MAGIYGALAVQGKPVEAITEQRVVMVGAGSAGMGVVQMLALGMVKHVSPCCACAIKPMACKIAETGGMHARIHKQKACNSEAAAAWELGWQAGGCEPGFAAFPLVSTALLPACRVSAMKKRAPGFTSWTQKG